VNVVRDASQAIASVARKAALGVARAVLTLIEDAHALQLLQAQSDMGDVWNGIQRFQEYGFTSVPLPGAEAIIVCLHGLRSNGVAIATDDRRYRIQNLPGGAVAIYDAAGTTWVLNNDGTATVTAPVKIHYVTPRLEVTGDIIDQVGSGNAHTVAEMRAIYNAHYHGGVQPGGGNSAIPGAAM
jgi:phage baseplate assembly protein V